MFVSCSFHFECINFVFSLMGCINTVQLSCFCVHVDVSHADVQPI